jgi:hypothetical protein
VVPAGVALPQLQLWQLCLVLGSSPNVKEKSVLAFCERQCWRQLLVMPMVTFTAVVHRKALASANTKGQV